MRGVAVSAATMHPRTGALAYHGAPMRHDHILALSCPDRTGIVYRVSGLLFGQGMQHRRRPAVRRRRDRPLLPARAFRAAGGRCAAHPEGAVRPAGRRVRDGLADPRCAPPPAPAGAGEQAGPLPQRPAVPRAQRPAAGGHRRGRLQPHRLCRAVDVLRGAVPPLAGGRQQPPGAGAGDHRPGRARAGRPGGAGALHADPLAAPVCKALPGARSTSTTASCPASRAPSRTTRRTREGSRSSAPPRTT